MDHRVPPHFAQQFPPEIAARCSELGLPLWRFDLAGNVLDEPSEDGVLGLWLRSGPIADLLSAAVAAWNGCENPDLVELFPGAWLLPVVQIKRRSRVGYTLALALGPEVVAAEVFNAACNSVQIDPAVIRFALADRATHSHADAGRTLRLLRWMSKDLDRLGRERDAIDGFTAQLTDAYETINMLYSVGQSMCDLTSPDRFVRRMVDRLHETMNFGWIACRFTDSDRNESLRGLRLLAGSCDCPGDSGEDLLKSIESRLPTTDQTGASIIPMDPKAPLALGPQVVAQPLRRDGTLFGYLMAGGKTGSDPQVNSYETLMIEAASGFMVSFLENVSLYAEQHRTFLGTIHAMTQAIDAKDHYTRGHSDRVACLAAALARQIGLDPEQVARIEIAGQVHDVGKIGVPEHVLAKPGKLTPEEWDLVKQHPEIGHRILKDIPPLADLLPGVLHHHERWDGNGYPHGLAGEDIPLMARIIGVADTFDAMSSTRSYRPALSRDDVLEEMRRAAGSQHDARLVDAFLSLDLGFYDKLEVPSDDEIGPATKAA